MARNTTLAAGTGTLTAAADPANTDAITIGDLVYTWVTTPSSAFDVDVGATRQGSLDNMVLAINLTGTPGATTYHTATTENPYVTAVRSDDTIVLTARVKGKTGITTTTSETDITFGAATLTGTGIVADFLSGLVDLNQLNGEVLSELNYLCTEIDP